jgi:sugar/nucleoside kinase (ribokinase family)
LNKLGLEKGTRKVVNHEERGRVLQAMDGCSYKAAAGGSLSNSLVALARLGSRPIGGPALNVAMVGSVGSDPLGGFYRSGAVSTTHTCFIDFLFRSK